MKRNKRKLKFAAIFGLCWFGVCVFLVDGVVGFQNLVDRVGSWAAVEISLWLLVLAPTVAVYKFTQEKTEEFDQGTEKNR